MSQAEPEIVIGVIVAPFGIKGEVKVRMETDFPERYRDLKEVHVKLPDGTLKVMGIESVRFHKGQALVKFDGCSDMNCAEELRGGELRIDVSQMAKLPLGHFYVRDLIGIKVITEDGVELGEVNEVMTGAGNDVYVVGDLMIPAVREFVKEVNLEERRMTVCRREALEMEEA